MSIQLFQFNSHQVRTAKDEEGNIYFHGKDICDVLEYSKHRDALAGLDVDEKRPFRVDGTSPKGGNPNHTFINESGLYSLIFGSGKSEAKVFKKWVTSVVLPTLRRTGRYVMTDYLQESPRSWSKIYPDKYFEHVLRLYGYEFQKGVNPPQFIGHFTNEFVYKALDGQLPAELKKRQEIILSLDDQRTLMHQYLNSAGKDVLEKHLDKVVTLMEVASTIDQFRTLWSRSITHRNQMELYLR